MMKLEQVVVNSFNPHTKTARGDMVRTVYVEYNEDGEVTAIHTAHPNLRGSKDAFGRAGVVVDRKPVMYVTSDAYGKTITLGHLNSDTERSVVPNKEFDKKYPGLPVTM